MESPSVNTALYFEAYESTGQLMESVESTPERIEEIRKISNVIQALENLANQCSDRPDFDHLRLFAERSIIQSNLELRRVIHQ